MNRFDGAIGTAGGGIQTVVLIGTNSGIASRIHIGKGIYSDLDLVCSRATARSGGEAWDSDLALIIQLDRSDWGLAIFELFGDGLASGQAHGSFFDV